MKTLRRLTAIQNLRRVLVRFPAGWFPLRLLVCLQYDPFKIAAYLLFAIMCMIAFSLAVRATSGLQWPDNIDMYRDIGMAQSIMDGYYPADYQFLGESNWYNPLAAFTVAAVSYVTGAATHVADVQLGAYINVLIPVTFFLLVSYWFNPFVALLGSTYLLFGVGYENLASDSWARISYSPWLFEPTLTLPLFFLTLLCYTRALRTQKLKWFAFAGIMHGLTFFGHAAPALILGGIIGLLTFQKIFVHWTEKFDSPKLLRTFGIFAGIMLLALGTSLPFWWPIWSQYRFKMETVGHAAWFYDILLLKNIGAFTQEQTKAPNVAVVFGFLGIWLRQGKPSERQVLLAWLLIVMLFLVHNYAWQILKAYGINAPIFVPSYHFLLYFSAVKAVLFGFGAFLICKLLLQLAASVQLPALRILQTSSAHKIAAISTSCFLAVILLPSYRNWTEINGSHNVKNRTDYFDDFKSYRQILAFTKPTDVFLCNDNLASFIVAPAARKLVSASAEFSNPYSKAKQRNLDQDQMLDALKTGDQIVLKHGKSAYKIKYVLAERSEALLFEKASGIYLRQVYEDNRVKIYELIL